MFCLWSLVSNGSILEQSDSGKALELLEFLRRSVNSRAENLAHPMANAGLLFYRIGQLKEGRELYEEAMRIAEKQGSYIQRAMAATINCREAILSSAPWASEALQQAQTLAKQVNSAGVNFYLRKLEALTKNPGKAGEILNPGHAGKFVFPVRVINPLKGVRLEHSESGPILWLPQHLVKRG
jgi:tetratricopeptide (TPR) repeat protein